MENQNSKILSFEEFLNKGSEIAVDGKLITKDYTDKDGKKKYVTEVQVNELLLLGLKMKIMSNLIWTIYYQ